MYSQNSSPSQPGLLCNLSGCHVIFIGSGVFNCLPFSPTLLLSLSLSPPDHKTTGYFSSLFPALLLYTRASLRKIHRLSLLSVRPIQHADRKEEEEEKKKKTKKKKKKKKPKS